MLFRSAKLRHQDRDARWPVHYMKAKAGAEPKAPRPVDLDVPMFGYMSHIAIDRAHGLIRTFTVPAVNAHDGAQFANLISRDNIGSGVWVDTAYRSKKDEAFLKRRLLTRHIHRKKPPERPMPVRTAKANAKRSVVRSVVEPVFGQNLRMHLVVRTIRIARATIRIGMANPVCNFQRCTWLDGRAMPV